MANPLHTRPQHCDQGIYSAGRDMQAAHERWSGPDMVTRRASRVGQLNSQAGREKRTTWPPTGPK